MPDVKVPDVKMYTTTWCGICVHTKRYLNFKKVAIEEIDIEEHPEFGDMIERETGGYRIVPTLEIGGKLMVNPSRREIDEALAAASPEKPAESPKPEAARPKRRATRKTPSATTRRRTPSS